jgi:hypothetical protein
MDKAKYLFLVTQQRPERLFPALGRGVSEVGLFDSYSEFQLFN